MTLLILMMTMLFLMRVLRTFDDLRKNTFVHPNDNIAHQKLQVEHQKV